MVLGLLASIIAAFDYFSRLWVFAVEAAKQIVKTMISVLAQERLLGAALGSAITGIIVFEQRKCIYNSIADNQSRVDSKSLAREPIFPKKTRSEFAHIWNKAVDQTFGPLIESLSSRGW